MTRRLAGAQLIAVLATAVLFVIALVSGHTAHYADALTLFPWLGGAGLVTLVLGVARNRARSLSGIAAGALALFSAIALPVWIFGVTLAVYPDDVARACIESAGDQHVDQNLQVIRSLLPPGLFCLPKGAGSHLVLVTPLPTVVAASVGLIIPLVTLTFAVVLIVRALRSTSTKIEG